MALSDPEKANIISARSALLDYYSDRATSFGGFFLASIFGLLTMMALVQGIKCNNATIESLLLILSVFPIFVFAYMGQYVMKRFSYYAVIASSIDQGDGTAKGNGLRFVAALNDITCLNKNKDGEWEKISVSQLFKNEYPKQKKLIGKKIINSQWFMIIYWVLILVLLVITYIPSIIIN